MFFGGGCSNNQNTFFQFHTLSLYYVRIHHLGLFSENKGKEEPPINLAVGKLETSFMSDDPDWSSDKPCCITNGFPTICAGLTMREHHFKDNDAFASDINSGSF